MCHQSSVDNIQIIKGFTGHIISKTSTFFAKFNIVVKNDFI